MKTLHYRSSGGLCSWVQEQAMPWQAFVTDTRLQSSPFHSNSNSCPMGTKDFYQDTGDVGHFGLLNVN